MASGGRPDGGKPTAKKASGGAGTGRKPSDPKGKKPCSGRSPGKSSGWRSKLPPAPLLAAWVMAVLALAGILYFSGSGGRHSRQPLSQPSPPSGAEQSRKYSPANIPGKTSSGRTDPTQAKPSDSIHPVEAGAPSGPVIAPKPFSSTDLPSEPASSKDLLALGRPAPTAPAPRPPTAPISGRIAIIIDDFGPDLEIAEEFAALPFAVTFSVLPQLAHSADIARLAGSRGREVILHLPMEPYGYPKMDPGAGALLLSMSENALRRQIGLALDASPNFRGVNNHMGSRMTEDSRAMKIVVEEVNRRGLYFVDSFTSPKSKAFSAAREMKIRTLRRDIFLDHNQSADSIRSQVARLIKIARVKGTALAIGHPHRETLKQLRAASDEFGKQGIKVVAASELANGS